MPAIKYYIPREGSHFEIEIEKEITPGEAIDLVAEMEEVKRVPPTWKIWYTKNGTEFEVNRSAARRVK